MKQIPLISGMIFTSLFLISCEEEIVSGGNYPYCPSGDQITFSVEKSTFQYEVTNTNDYTILVSKNENTIDLVDYWAMNGQPANMEVFAELSNDTLIISYNDTTTLNPIYDWMPTVKTTAQVVFESGIDSINFLTVISPGGRGGFEGEEINYRVANSDTTLSID